MPIITGVIVAIIFLSLGAIAFAYLLKGKS